MLNELFEIELIIYIKMNLALSNLQMLLCLKTQPTNQPTNQPNNWLRKQTNEAI